VVITPPLGTVINGNMRPIIADNVHDELHARALALTDGKTTLAFVVVDNCVIPREIFDAAKALLKTRSRVPPENVIMSATHSHSCGSLVDAFLSPPSEAYRAQCRVTSADAVRRPCTISRPAHRLGQREPAGRGLLPALALEGRRQGAESRDRGNDLVKMNPGIGHADITEPAGRPTRRFPCSRWSTPMENRSRAGQLFTALCGRSGDGGFIGGLLRRICGSPPGTARADRQDRPWSAS